jgi:MFS family permease
MVASMFVTVAIVYGLSFDIIGIFYNPIAKEFGLSRAKFSSLATAFSLSFLVGGLVAGWLLDRIGAQFVVVGGAMVVIGGLLVASAASSFNAMLLAYFLIGLGVSAAIITSYMVVNNWFSEGRRTFALAITFCGLSVGEMAMAWTATYAISNSGWRSAYLIFAAMVLVLVIPLDLITVRTRPAGAGTLRSVAEAGRALPGLDLARAFRTGTLYTLALIYLCYGISISISLVHEVMQLQEIGFSPERAGKIWGTLLGSTLLARPLMGYLGDHIGNRAAAVFSFAAYAFAMIASIFSREIVWFVLFCVTFPIAAAAPSVVLAVFVNELLGLKRYGTFMGIMNAAVSVGLATGPVVAGHIFDVTHSYTGAFEVAAVVSIITAIAIQLCPVPRPEPPAASVIEQSAGIAVKSQVPGGLTLGSRRSH